MRAIRCYKISIRYLRYISHSMSLYVTCHSCLVSLFRPPQKALRGVGGVEAPLKLRRRHVTVCAQSLEAKCPNFSEAKRKIEEHCSKPFFYAFLCLSILHLSKIVCKNSRKIDTIVHSIMIYYIIYIMYLFNEDMLQGFRSTIVCSICSTLLSVSLSVSLSVRPVPPVLPESLVATLVLPVLPVPPVLLCFLSFCCASATHGAGYFRLLQAT